MRSHADRIMDTIPDKTKERGQVNIVEAESWAPEGADYKMVTDYEDELYFKLEEDGKQDDGMGIRFLIKYWSGLMWEPWDVLPSF